MTPVWMTFVSSGEWDTLCRSCQLQWTEQGRATEHAESTIKIQAGSRHDCPPFESIQDNADWTSTPTLISLSTKIPRASGFATPHSMRSPASHLARWNA